MDNNFNGNMGGNPEGNNVVGKVLKSLVGDAAKFKLQEMQKADLTDDEIVAYTFLNSFVKLIVEKYQLSEALKVGAFKNRESMNMLRGFSEFVLDCIQEGKYFDEFCEMLPEDAREYFDDEENKKNKKILRQVLTLEHIESVIRKLDRIDFFSKLQIIAEKVLKGNFESGDFKSLFWTEENNKGKAAVCLKVADIVLICFVAVTYSLLYVGYRLLDSYVSKKVDEKRKIQSAIRRDFLIKADQNSTALVEVKKMREELYSLEKKGVLNKILDGDFKSINRYDVIECTFSVLSRIIITPLLLGDIFVAIRRMLDNSEKSNALKSIKDKVRLTDSGNGGKGKVPKTNDDNDSLNSTMDEINTEGI